MVQYSHMALLSQILDHILGMPHRRGHRFAIPKQAGHVGKPEQQSLGVPATGYGSNNVNIKHTHTSCPKQLHKIHAIKTFPYATQAVILEAYSIVTGQEEQGETCSNLEKKPHERTTSEREDVRGTKNNSQE